ncbi:hypothetical protein NIES4072_01970 [Nostoc commune NIES-4072]|uniref:Uncharacterized protein n=1 Tax=Nostoc commune NIES-4072 TaxID=2005467 RepID=A0A2R5FL87_NOSCO|nr:hypothetical protein NIES4070_24850 [Nostoc commune HK-02]GBG16551.1 hypothetical protein NIES4072_01970 [Nostoc commune NIES-4072]
MILLLLKTDWQINTINFSKDNNSIFSESLKAFTKKTY